MNEGEVTMIFLDTFYWLHDRHTSCWFHDQIDAAQIYCERKLKAHPDNLVGIVIFGKLVSDVVHPTNDLESIRKRLACLGTESQIPDLSKGIDLCCSCWYPYQQMRKRVLVFSAGPLLTSGYMEAIFVDLLKKSRAVVDVVHFGYRPKGLLKGLLKSKDYKPEEDLKALVNDMNDNNNNKENEDRRFFSIEDDGFSLSHHISSSSIVAEEEAPIIHSLSKAKIHSSVGEEVVDSDWYGEEVFDSGWYEEEEGEEVFDSYYIREESVNVGWD